MVPGVGNQGRAFETAAGGRCPAVEDFLTHDGQCRRRRRDPAGVAGAILFQVAQRIPADADACSGEHGTDENRYHRFKPTVAVRMAMVRRPGPEMRSHDHSDIGNRVGQAVDSIGNHCLTSAPVTGNEFKARKQQVEDQSDPGDSANGFFSGHTSRIFIE